MGLNLFENVIRTIRRYIILIIINSYMCDNRNIQKDYDLR